MGYMIYLSQHLLSLIEHHYIHFIINWYGKLIFVLFIGAIIHFYELSFKYSYTDMVLNLFTNNNLF